MLLPIHVAAGGLAIVLGTVALLVKKGVTTRQPAQSVLRALRHLAAYGSTNKYRPVTNCKASGTTAKRPTEFVYFFCAIATTLTITATVKAMDSQRWVCRIHLFQFNMPP